VDKTHAFGLVMTQVLPNPSDGITKYLEQYSKVKSMITPK